MEKNNTTKTHRQNTKQTCITPTIIPLNGIWLDFIKTIISKKQFVHICNALHFVHTCDTTRQIVKLPIFRPLSRRHDIEAKNPTRKKS